MIAIQAELDEVQKMIEDQRMTEKNRDGILIGKADEYTSILTIDLDQMKEKFIAD